MYSIAVISRALAPFILVDRCIVLVVDDVVIFGDASLSSVMIAACTNDDLLTLSDGC